MKHNGYFSSPDLLISEPLGGGVEDVERMGVFQEEGVTKKSGSGRGKLVVLLFHYYQMWQWIICPSCNKD